METIGAIFGLLGFVSLIAVIKPFGPYKKRWQAFLGFIVLMAIGGALMPDPGPTATTPSTNQIAAESSTPTSTAPTEAAPAVATSRWRYSTSRDEMRNANTHLACIESSNRLRFEFPYQGGSTAEICVRESPQFGQDVWVRIQPGQFTCLMDCTIRVKFDDGDIQTFSAAGASDGSADIVFVSNFGRFVSGAKEASRIVVEAEFYQAGSHQMVFEEASGLEWPRG